LAGDFPEITFSLADNSGPVQLVEGDSTAVDRVAFVVSGPTTLYQHTIPGEDQSRVRPWNGGGINVDDPVSNWIDNFAGDGTYSYILEAAGASSKSTAWPAVYQAARNALPNQAFPFDEGWGQLYTAAGTPLDNGTYTVIAYARRRTVTANASEPAVVDTYDVLYGADDALVSYGGTVADNKCNACHQNLAFHGHARAGVRACLVCHTPGVQINEAGTDNLDLRVMIHKIHNGANLSVPYILTGDHGTEDFSHTLLPAMPDEARNVNLEHRLVWEYDLSTVTMEPPVDAVLNFTIRGAPIWPFPDMTVNVYSYPADLQETLADFSSGPAVLQGSAIVVGYQPATPYSLNVSEVVNQALLSSEDKVAFRFQIDPDTPYDANQAFVDALDSNPASKPALVISEPATPGDVNGDGVVNAGDIDAFIAVLLGTPLDPSDEARADLNGDDTADGDDAQPFVAALFASWE
jgi:hypothetical protein